MGDNKITVSVEQQFGEVIDIILQHKSRASKAVNKELLLTAWHVGGYVSAKLKSEEWGSKVVTQLSEYIRSQRPDIKGYSRRSLYNMVMFYEAYSTMSFLTTVENFLSSKNSTNCPDGNRTDAEDTGVDHIDQPYRDIMPL